MLMYSFRNRDLTLYTREGQKCEFLCVLLNAGPLGFQYARTIFVFVLLAVLCAVQKTHNRVASSHYVQRFLTQLCLYF